MLMVVVVAGFFFSIAFGFLFPPCILSVGVCRCSPLCSECPRSLFIAEALRRGPAQGFRKPRNKPHRKHEGGGVGLAPFALHACTLAALSSFVGSMYVLYAYLLSCFARSAILYGVSLFDPTYAVVPAVMCASLTIHTTNTTSR